MTESKPFEDYGSSSGSEDNNYGFDSGLVQNLDESNFF
jgi:hypothetical protein